MIKDLQEKLKATLEQLEVGDVDGAKKSIKVMLAWFNGGTDKKYVSEVLFNSMKEWSDVREGVIYTDKLVTKLEEAGVLK